MSRNVLKFVQKIKKYGSTNTGCALNMTKIESRPITGKNWQYRFFVDFEGNLKDSAVKNALRGIEAEADRMRILGNY